MDAWGFYIHPCSLQIAMALLNARMSAMSFNRWSIPVFLPLISFMLSKFSLILPLVSIVNFPCKIDFFSSSLIFVLCIRAIYRPYGSSYCRLHHWSSVLLVIWNLVSTANFFFWYAGMEIMFYEMNAQLVCQLLFDKYGIGAIIKTLNHMVFTNFHWTWSMGFSNTEVGFWSFSFHSAVEDVGMSKEEIKKVEDLRSQLAHRQAWMASSIHRGEEEGYVSPRNLMHVCF